MTESPASTDTESLDDGSVDAAKAGSADPAGSGAETTDSAEAAGVQPVEPALPEAAVPVARRRAARKPSKPDAVLAAAVDTARNGVLEVAGDTEVGEHLGAFPEAERLVTHRFAANVPGYGGWHWFATLARIPRGKDATVSEVGLLPSEDALLAPDWVPWSERVRPEDTAEEESAAGVTPGDAPQAEADAADADGADSTEADAADSTEADAGTTPGDESPVD
ncbi:DUF3027 domain-containing protein [uncultured Arthrobacter sp.]|uniref:DUF3027 domain-containing protein n=1 Tax=uncultured Arthrobacter sp. TaxID=114050 RepID=UPI002630C694|nr:DUF3027 domain-containing protein [uncultured Arthrobacter sp.]